MFNQGMATSNYNDINHKSRLIYEHNRYQNTDKLYQPLRGVLFHPEETIKHQSFAPIAAKNSMLTHQYHFLTPQEASKIRENVYIPVDRPLVPTNHLYKVKNNKFFVVDTQEKVLGTPISSQQLDRLRRQPFKQEKIVYDFDGFYQPPSQPARAPVYPPPPPRQPSEPKITITPEVINQVVQQKPPKYHAPPIQQSKVKQNYKYNLYSMIDQPMNKLKNQGCGSLTCPSNQIIASRNQPQSISWLSQ